MLMHKNIHKIPQSNMYYPHTILYLDCIHWYNAHKKRWQALTACHPFAEEERLELPSSVLETNVLPLNYSSVV